MIKRNLKCETQHWVMKNKLVPQYEKGFSIFFSHLLCRENARKEIILIVSSFSF